MKILTTLAEGDYFLGAAALLNSVVAHGTYVDKVVIGYRHGLPDWLPATTPSRNGRTFLTGSGLPVELVEMDGSLHMVHEKPRWFHHLTEVLEPTAEEFFFFDSDIVIKNRMSFFGEWVEEGVAVCGDVNYEFAPDHPIRRKWRRVGEAGGAPTINELGAYFNSGFLGWRREHAEFITDWNRAFDLLAPYSGDMTKFRVKNRSAMVLSTNQDSLNLALMITRVPYATLGPEAMAFDHGLQLMDHPLGPKPWRRNFFRDMLNGNTPRDGDVSFWRAVNGSELSPVPQSQQQFKLRSCQFYRFLGRFYKRN